MGNTLENAFETMRGWFESTFSQKKATILMVGLDAAGKTTIVVKLKLNTTQETVPTIGFNVETVQYKNITFHLWDVGGQERLRKLWKHYYDGVNAIIFVIDSANSDRFSEVKKELEVLLNEPVLQDASLLILCNKQDLPQAVSPASIGTILGLRSTSSGSLGSLLGSRKWFVQGCCAHSGAGVYEGFDWLSSHLPDWV